MSTETIQKDFQNKVCESVRVAPEGMDRYRVFTPFMFDDGDHLAVVLRKDAGQWVLTDEGHTYMHLTYDLDERQFQEGTRAKIIDNALNAFSVNDRGGELILPIPDEKYGDALYSFVQALLKVTDVTFLTRERVRSTFMEDFHSFLYEQIPPERMQFEWTDPQHDPDGKYEVDCRVNGMEYPLFLFGLHHDNKVRDATISLLQFEQWDMRFQSLGIFENQEDINRKVLARFSDVCDKQFSSLAGNYDRVGGYLEKTLQRGQNA